jgi:hypothetical protein
MLQTSQCSILEDHNLINFGITCFPQGVISCVYNVATNHVLHFHCVHSCYLKVIGHNVMHTFYTIKMSYLTNGGMLMLVVLLVNLTELAMLVGS